MTDRVEKPPAMPASIADAWAAVYIDVGAKLEEADGQADEPSPAGESNDKHAAAKAA